MRAAMRMVHDKDPAKEIREAAGDLSGVDLSGNQVLLGLYKRPEKTASGIILSDVTRKEDEYQGKVGLVLKLGPQAFDDGEYFKGWRVKEGDWVVCWVSDGRQVGVNKQLCRVVKDNEVRMRVDAPDQVY